jgi:hypothetical protein
MIYFQTLYTLQLYLDQLDLFKKKSKTTTDLVCKICNMKFSDPERTTRHMIKAHSKPQKVKKRLGSGKYD